MPGSAAAADRSSSPQRGRDRERPKGILVRNTFIDVCPLEEESDAEGGSRPASPHRRNASAPPSPTRQRQGQGEEWGVGEEEALEADPSSIPHPEWVESGLASAGAEATKVPDDVKLPAWLQKAPGSPKNIAALPPNPNKISALPPHGRSTGSTDGVLPRPALGEFLKGSTQVWGPPGAGRPEEDFVLGGFGLGFGKGADFGWGEDRGRGFHDSGFGTWGSAQPPYGADLFQDHGPPTFSSSRDDFSATTCMPVLTQQRLPTSGAWPPRGGDPWQDSGFGGYPSDGPPPRGRGGAHEAEAAAAHPVLASQPVPGRQAIGSRRPMPPEYGDYGFGGGPPHWGSPGAYGEFDGGYPPFGFPGGPPLQRGRHEQGGKGGKGVHYPIAGSGFDGWHGPTEHQGQGYSRQEKGQGRPWTRMERDRMESPAVGGPLGKGSGKGSDAGFGFDSGKGGPWVKGGGGVGGGSEQRGRAPLSGGGPKRTDYQKKYGPEGEGGGGVPITTMMLKNIPCRKSQEEVMSHIDSKDFGDKYDFFYLPRDVKFRANLGYAFINFVTPEDAAQFQDEFDGYRFSSSGSVKACQVVPAHVQGLVNNLAAFKRTEVMRSSRKPYFSGVVGA